MLNEATIPNSTSIQPQYIVGTWGHLFDDHKSERNTRIVIDAHSRKLIYLGIQTNRTIHDAYREGESNEVSDVEDSLLNANAELFDNPTDFGLELVSELPDWITRGFHIGDVIFYRPDPGAYGAIKVRSVGVSIEGYSAYREMVLPFSASDLCTAEELGKELETLIFESPDVLYRTEKIMARIGALQSVTQTQT